MTIKEARLEAGLTQQRMSEVLLIPKRTIENWEGGKNICPPWAERLIIAELQRIKEKGEIMMYNDKELKAMKAILEYVDIDESNLETYLVDDSISINKGRDGNTYAWLFDELHDVAVNVETLELIDDKDKTEELFA